MARANLTRFRQEACDRYGLELSDYRAVHRWSIKQPEQFWALLWDFTQVICDERGQRVTSADDNMTRARFFPDAKLNFACNLLRRRDGADAIVYRGEAGVTRRVSWAELYRTVARSAHAMRRLGVVPGDRVAAILPNIPEAIVAMLAAASIGAIWSSCSPDSSTRGILHRLGQIGAKLLFVVDGYSYNGDIVDIRRKVADVHRAMPTVELVISIPFAGCGEIAGTTPFAAFEAPGGPRDIEFEPLAFNHPLCILFSNGASHKPKCVVHAAGGTLLQCLKEHRLHCDSRRGDRLFSLTACGSAVWTWLVSALASESTVMLYDGSPFVADGYALFEYAQSEGFTHFGMSGGFIRACEKHGVVPKSRYSFDAVRQVLATRSALAPACFDYLHGNFKRDVGVSALPGGADVIGCFVQGDPTGPVHRGELQVPALAMATEVWDDAGRRITGRAGELVCVRPFPSMPLSFLNDVRGARYRAAYLERFPGVWAGGDRAEITANGGFVFYGCGNST